MSVSTEYWKKKRAEEIASLPEMMRLQEERILKPNEARESPQLAELPEEKLRERWERKLEIDNIFKKIDRMRPMQGDEFLKKLQASKAWKKCWICGEKDNSWKPRGGLCLDCFCREWLIRSKEKEKERKREFLRVVPLEEATESTSSTSMAEDSSIS